MVVRHERDLVAAHVAEVAPDAVIADQDEVTGHRARHRVRPGRPAGRPRRHRARDVRRRAAADRGHPARAARGAHRQRAAPSTVITASAAGRDRLRPCSSATPYGVRRRRLSSRRTRPRTGGTVTEINAGVYVFQGAGAACAPGLRRASRELAGREVPDRCGGVLLRRLPAHGGGFQRTGCRRPLAAPGRERPRSAGRGRGGVRTRRTDGRWQPRGVTILDPATTWIDVTARARSGMSPCSRTRTSCAPPLWMRARQSDPTPASSTARSAKVRPSPPPTRRSP